MAKVAWESCPRCSQFPKGVSVSLLGMDGEDASVPEAAFELTGLSEEMLSSGYKAWQVHCDLCGTRYLAEVDVEPFVHDFTLSREQSGKAVTQFGEEYLFD